MNEALTFLGDWLHVLAAALFTALAIWVGRRHAQADGTKLLVAALCLTAAWALLIAFQGVHRLETGLLESLRNCAWLTTFFTMPLRLGQRGQGRPIGFTIVYAVLVVTLVLQSLVDMFWSINIAGSEGGAVIVETGLILRMTWVIGALIITERLFAATDPLRRARIAPIMAAMTAMWAYDLVLYGNAYFDTGLTEPLFALRGGVIMCLAPVIALAERSSATTIAPSRVLAVRGIGMAAVLILCIAILAGVAFIDLLASPVLRLAATGSIFAIIVCALVVLPSERFRSFVRVMVAKHLFQHRYDYRAQWMGFADTIGQVTAADAPLYERVIKAVADITESPGGLLLLMEGEHLAVHSAWNWPDDQMIGKTVDGAFVAQLKQRFWVVDIDQARERAGVLALPDWISASQTAWALVPVIHFDQLAGALLLARPRLSRSLDWEDFDMLRTAGRQVASYIAEAQGQEKLSEVRRFDEFNRRFAFIMHDIKNLVSQLSLLSRNAQRHADNPEFRADMILTLQDSVGKMNDLLARLSQHTNVAPREPVNFGLVEVALAAKNAKQRAHPIEIDGDMLVRASADPARIEQIVLHLVQNAIDASPADVPVVLHLEQVGEMATLTVIDEGCGMTPEFVRNDLFRPFASSKPGGFGIGAFEARELAYAAGGTLRVESIPGKGSHFTLSLPRGDADIFSHDDRTEKERAA